MIKNTIIDLIKQFFILFIVMASLAGIGTLGIWGVPVLILIVYFMIKMNDKDKEIKELKDKYEPTINHKAVREYLNSEQFKTSSKFTNSTAYEEDK